MRSARAFSRRINPVFLAFFVVAFLSGIAGALQAPTLSLFLSTELKVRPLWVGLFYTVNAIAGITVSFLLAKRSDLGGDRRKLILICYLMAVGNCLLFAFNRDYLTLITLGVLMASVANTAMPQIFALAREYADNSAREVVMFSSIMRAQLSLAWVIGPPLSFMLALNYGFTLMFSIAAGIFVISALVVWFILPSVKQPEPVADAPVVVQGSLFADKNVLLLFIASMLMWTCNTMYIIDMPLYITANLGLPERLAGLLMGTAAGLEIPIMLLAGYSVRRFGKRKIMLFAVMAGVLFYTGLVLFKFKTALMILLS
ncbi:MFS transporter, partial [Yersinia pestis]